MVFFNRKFECERYVIANHYLSADVKTFFPKSLTAPPVKCYILEDELPKRDTTIAVPAPLLEDFEAACAGRSERFKLMRVAIRDGVLSLDFADLREPIIYGGRVYQYPCHSICFRDYSGMFTVEMDDGRHKTVHEFNFHSDGKYGYGENGNRLIAKFNECRGSKERRYSNSSIIMINGRQ